MKAVLIILCCLLCASAQAQIRFRDRPAGGRDNEQTQQRRERLQEFRQEMRRQEAQRQDDRWSRRAEADRAKQDRSDRGDGNAPDRGLRRLSPEDRQRLRQEMRDAFRR